MAEQILGEGKSACCAKTSETNCESEAEKPQLSFRQFCEKLKKLNSVWMAIIVVPLVVWVFDPAKIGDVISIASSAFWGTLPFIVFAVLLIAYLKSTGAETLVARVFEGRINRMIVLASLFGGLAPFCSCEVIPFIAGLLALGAPLPAVMAFWLSSPLIDPPSLLITAGALGWQFAIGKALAAVCIGLLGGFFLKALMRHSIYRFPLKNEPNTGGCCQVKQAQEKPKWAFWQDSQRRKEFAAQTTENGFFLIKWLAFAYILEALLILYVPASAVVAVVGGSGFGAIVIAALVGMPAYLNSYAAPPLVAGLIEQGMTIGSAMAFMIAGSISSIPAMTAVWSLVRRAVFFTYLGIGFVGAVLLGFVFELLIAFNFR